MKHSIKIDAGKNFGNINGKIDEYFWYANVSEEIISNGLNLNSLKSTGGHIKKIIIYKLEDGIVGNPNLPSIATKRTVFINYTEKWIIYNKGFEDMLIELLNYLERRVTISIVKF